MQPHIRAFVDRAVTFTACPECGGTRLNEAARSSKIKGISIADACAMQISDLAEWVARPRRAVGGAAARGAAADPRLVRGDRARLPLARALLGHALGRRGAARQAGPPARLLADRRHLRLRRADDRAAPARHPADERAAAAAARQGQHGAGRRAQAGGDRDRRPGRRPRPRRRQRRWRGCVRGQRRRAARQRHADRAAPRRPRLAEGDGAGAVGSAGGARRRHQQSAGRRRRHPARRAGRDHRRRRVGQELADRRLGGGAGRGGGGRPGGDQGLAAQQPGDLHRPARPDPQSVRESQRRQAGAVQRQLRRRLPGLQRRRRHLHRPGDDGRRRHHLRGVRGEAVPGRGARVQVRRQGHQRGAGDVGRRGGGVLRRRRGEDAGRAQDPRAPGRRRPRLPQPSASRCRRCPAASGSG